MTTIQEKFIAARGASGKTIAQMTDLAGMKSTNTYQDREKDPLQFRLCELKRMHDGVNEISQGIIRDAVNQIFLS